LVEKSFVGGESLRQLQVPNIAESDPRKDQKKKAYTSYFSALRTLTGLPVYDRHTNSAGAEYVASLFFCCWQKNEFNATPRQAWSLCKVPAKVRETFASELAELFPSGRASEYLLLALSELVNAMYSFYYKNEDKRPHMFRVLSTYMISGSALIERAFPIVVKRRLTVAAKAQASKRKNYKPKDKDYEQYKAVHKPLIDLKTARLKAEEHAMLAHLNKQLNVAGTYVKSLPSCSAPSLYEKASAFISDISRDVAKVNRVLDSRKSKMHSFILQQRWMRKYQTASPSVEQRAEDRLDPISKEEWVYAFENLGSQDLQDVVVATFCSDSDLTPYLVGKAMRFFS
jgi:hypothetical protein